MKFIANILVKVEIEADTEEFAKELLSSNYKIHLKSFGGQRDRGIYSIQSVSQRVMNIQKKSFQFVLKLKGSESYLKSSEGAVRSYTDDINWAFKWKCNTSIDELKIDEDIYEIVVI